MGRHTLAFIALCFTITAVMAAAVAGETTGTAFDRAFAGALPGTDVLRPLGYATHPAVMIGLVAIIGGIALGLRRPRVALLAVAAPVVTATLNTVVLKPFIGRLHDGDLAFPSGHTATLVSILSVPVLVILTSATRREALITVSTALLCVAVAASAIVGLGYHYVTDTIGALFWAVGAVLSLALVLDPPLRTVSSRFTRPVNTK